MKRVVVTITFDKGQTICEPSQVVVGPGDTVRWTCEEGTLEVVFEHENPFSKMQVWTASRDQLTPVAVVNSGLVSKTIFRPKISINGTVVATSLGDIIIQ